jgi:hypothetical protein
MMAVGHAAAGRGGRTGILQRACERMVRFQPWIPASRPAGPRFRGRSPFLPDLAEVPWIAGRGVSRHAGMRGCHRRPEAPFLGQAMPPPRRLPRAVAGIPAGSLNPNKPQNMKTYSILGLLACALTLAGTARAADEAKTINCEAMCAKCELKLQKTCQTVIQVKEGDKTVTYYLAANDVAKAFHPTVCREPAEVTATGTISTVDGKNVLTASTIKVKE